MQSSSLPAPHLLPKDEKSIFSVILGGPKAWAVRVAPSTTAPGLAILAEGVAASLSAVSMRLRVSAEKLTAAARNSFGERLARAVTAECARVESSFSSAEETPSAAMRRQPMISGKAKERSVSSACRAKRG